MKIKQNKIAVVLKLDVLSKFWSKIHEYPSVADSEGKKGPHGV